MSDGAGGLDTSYEFRAWRDRVEARLGAHEVHIEHGSKEHDRHRESIRELTARVERLFEQSAARMTADIERESAQTRLQVAQQIAAGEKATRDVVAELADELRQQIAALQEKAQTQAAPSAQAAAATPPLRSLLFFGGIGAGALMVVGFVLGLIVKLQTVADLAAGAVAP